MHLRRTPSGVRLSYWQTRERSLRVNLRTITLAVGLVLVTAIASTILLTRNTRSAAEANPPSTTTTTTTPALGPEYAAAIDAAAVGAYLEGLAVQAYLDALHQAELEAQAQATQAARSGGVGGSCNGDVKCFLECTRAHESDTAGGYGAVSSSGTYRGAYQFQQSTWDAAVAGAGHDEYVGMPPDQVPPEIQDAAAAHLYSVSGTRPWGGRC